MSNYSRRIPKRKRLHESWLIDEVLGSIVWAEGALARHLFDLPS
jgi:hypothetical protein